MEAKAIKARPAAEPRILKTMRIKGEIVDLVKEMSPKLKLSESEIFECGAWLVYQKMYHKLNKK